MYFRHTKTHLPVLTMANDNDCCGLLGSAGVVLYPILTLWTFFGMAFVAEEYFGPALDGLVAKHRIPDAVAGATVLAVGTSFPELIIGFASQFLVDPEPSIAMGVTAGSAIFNQLGCTNVSSAMGSQFCLLGTLRPRSAPNRSPT